MKNERCADCGNNPVPHFLLYSAQTIGYVTGQFPWRNTSISNNFLLRAVNNLLETTRIIQWKTDFQTTSMRTKVVIDGAFIEGVQLEQQYTFRQATDTFRYKLNGKWHEFYSLPTPNDNPSLRLKLDNKWQTKKLLQSFNAQTPKGFVVKSEKQLKSAISKLTYPVIIKPAQGSRGRHTHVFLHNWDEALGAFRNAKKICAYVLCEQMLHGDVYRLTTVNSKLVASLRGEVPYIIGNGTLSVKELIIIKNDTKPSEVAPVIINDELINYLKRQNVTPKTILKNGKKILLGQKIGLRYGGDAVEVTPLVHQSFTDEIERVATKLPLFVLGFDVIAEDITKPADKQKWGIIEVNTIPFIDLHHYPRAGKPVPIAQLLWHEIIRSVQE